MKGRKRPNLFKVTRNAGLPVIDLSPTSEKLILPPQKVVKGKDDVMMSNWGYSDAQQDYNFLEERDSHESHRSLWRTLHALPIEVDKEFDVKYDDAKHGAYLK